MKKIAIFTFLFVGLFSCGGNPTKLSDDGRKIQTLDGKPYDGCEVAGKVKGESEIASLKLANNHARNLAADLGANYIKIEDEIINGHEAKVIAMAYDCP